MKRMIILSAWALIFAMTAKSMSLDEFKNHLERHRGDGGIAIDGIPLMRTPQDIAFLLYVAEDWQRALTLLEMEALDHWQQINIIVAAEFLPPKDYVRFLNGVCDLTEKGNLK